MPEIVVKQEKRTNKSNWTDAQWIGHLKIKKKELPELKKIMLENYLAYIRNFKWDNKWHVCIDLPYIKPSGAVHYIPFITITNGYRTEVQAIKSANKDISKIKFSEDFAKLNKISTETIHIISTFPRKNNWSKQYVRNSAVNSR